MSKGKGKETATEPDWKDKLAKLDQQFGWDEQAGSDWADDCDAEKQEVCYLNFLAQCEHDNKNFTNASQSTNKHEVLSATAKMDISSGSITDHELAASSQAETHNDHGSNNPFHNASDTFEDDEIMSPEIHRRIWDAAVEESRSSGHDHATPARYDDQEQFDAVQQEQMDHDEYRETEEEEWEEEIQPKSALAAYIYHRFGTGPIRYENRCSCCEYLRDEREERRKRDRAYFVQRGETCLIKDPCVLLPYRQEDLPGTEHVDKPVLMVTTPEGETLYPHDLEVYPEPLANSRNGARIEGRTPLAVLNEGDYCVRYEEEDTADI